MFLCVCQYVVYLFLYFLFQSLLSFCLLVISLSFVCLLVYLCVSCLSSCYFLVVCVVFVCLLVVSMSDCSVLSTSK